MEHLGDVGHVEPWFGPFVDSVVSVQDRCTVCIERTIGGKSFWTHTMELLGDVGHVESCFGPFGDYVHISPFAVAR
jgi:hypothetical protein